MSKRRMKILWAVFCVLAVIPLVWNFFFVRVPTVKAKNALDIMTRAADRVALLDIRSREDYDSFRLIPSVNMPYDEKFAENDFSGFLGKKILVLCESGLLSAPAVRILIRKGFDAHNVRDGMAAVIPAAGRKGLSQPLGFLGPCGKTASPPSLPLGAFPQNMQVFTGYGVKPLYTLFALILGIIFFRAKDETHRLLGWAMAAFFVGENGCAANYTFFADHDSHFLEYIHITGMLFCFGFFAYAASKGVKLHLLRYERPGSPCALRPLCGSCSGAGNPGCGLLNAFIFLGFALALCSLIPLFGRLWMVSLNSEIWGVFYNYSHPALYQLFEIRYCPVLAFGFFIAASVVIWKNRDMELAQALFAAGTGAMGFSFFRFMLFGVFRETPVWFEVWEELTEAVFIGALVVYLRLFSGLWPRKGEKGKNSPAGD